MKAYSVAAIAAGVAFLCGTAASIVAAAGPDLPATKAAEIPVDLGGGLDQRPRLVQTSLLTGSTAAGQLPRVGFQVRNVDAASVQAVVAKLGDLARFEPDGGGRPVPVVVEIGPARLPTFAFTLTVSPAEPLSADAWYTLAIDEDLALVVGSAEAAPGEDRGELRSRLFTGSAPQVRRLSRSVAKGKPGTVVDVVMSEPVRLAALVGGASVASGGRGLGGCVAWGADCVRPGQGHPELVSAFSVRLDRPLSGELPDGLEVLIDGRVAGAGRSVADGARVQGRPLVVSAPASQWRACTSERDSLCWTGGLKP